MFARLAFVVGSALLANLVGAQSFNIDMDIGFGSAGVGNGAPSSSFGAAAGQSGYWNRLYVGNHTHENPLSDLTGETSSAAVRWNPTGHGFGWGINNNVGDHRLLMNDGLTVTVPVTFAFSGFQPGRYQIYTYAADVRGNTVPAEVIIAGAAVERQLSGQGGLTDNTFALGISHSVHTLDLATDRFYVEVSTVNPGPPDTTLMGFQITYEPVPEPSVMTSFALGLSSFLVRRRR